MNRHSLLSIGLAITAGVWSAGAAEPNAGGSPADHLPAHILQATWFGERADRSHDGRKIPFRS